MDGPTQRLDRRTFIAASGGALVAAIAPIQIGSAAARPVTPRAEMTKEQWLDTLLNSRSLDNPLYLFRFVERVYVLTKPIAWAPNPGQAPKRVDVPPGFVTDFASIPRPFWAFLPPDGQYAYAAVVHDYLYWVQDRPREECDDIFKFAMEDLKVGGATIGTIHIALRLGGAGSWDVNKRAKQQGEKRIARTDKLPNDPTARWEDFKKRPGVFVD
jgi:hypothetical protein